MEFGLSEEQALLQDSVKKFLSTEVPLDTVRESAKEKDDKTIWQGLVDLGISGMLVPEAQGGLGMGTLDASIVAEQLGYHVTPSPFISTAVIAPFILSATDKQSDLLAAIALGESRVGIALGDTIALRHDQRLTEHNGHLSGKATFVLDTSADVYLIATPDKSIYLVNKDQIKIENRTTIDLTRSTCELNLENAQAELITKDTRVFNQATTIGRIMLAADTLGAAQSMIDKAVSYAKEREQFERVIASFQAVKHMCAEMTAGLEPCRAMVWYASHAFDNLPEESELTSCHCKAHISEVGKFVAKTSTEVHGGMGFTDLVGLHYWFKRIGFNRQLLGSPEMLRSEAAELQGLVART